VFNAFVALKEKGLLFCGYLNISKGLDFESHVVELGKKEQLNPEYFDKSITGRVPSLRHKDFWLAESSAIIEYLDEVTEPKHSLFPKDPQQRARARQIMAWLRSDLG
jgi:glutathione S-transferase